MFSLGALAVRVLLFFSPSAALLRRGTPDPGPTLRLSGSACRPDWARPGPGRTGGGTCRDSSVSRTLGGAGRAGPRPDPARARGFRRQAGGGYGVSSKSAFAQADQWSSEAGQERRPKNVRALVANFALTVTDRIPIGTGCKAKNGDESLFRIFQLMVPQVHEAGGESGD
jgi:hypothetical protein